MNRKKIIIAVVVLLLVAGVFLVPRFLHNRSDENIVSADPVEADALTHPGESETEVDYVSDPVYGDGITEEELQEMKEDAESPDAPSISIGDEFVIELGETQDTAGF